MSRQVIVNTAARALDSAFLRSLTIDEAAPSPLPDVVEDSSMDLEISFADPRLGALEPWSGAEDYTVEFAVGPLNKPPTAGTATPTGGGGSTGGVGTPVGAGATAQQMAAAIAGLDGITGSDISVQRVAEGHFLVEFIGTLADTDVPVLEFDSGALVPRSTVYVVTQREGGGGKNAIQSIRFLQNLVAYQDDWAPTANDSWTGTVRFNTAEAEEALAGRDRAQGIGYAIWVTPPGGDPRCYAQGTFTLGASVLQRGVTAPSPKPEYYTKIQADATFVAKTDPLTLLAGHFRVVDGVLQAREVGPVSGWREVQMYDGGWQAGDLTPDE